MWEEDTLQKVFLLALFVLNNSRSGRAAAGERKEESNSLLCAKTTIDNNVRAG